MRGKSATLSGQIGCSLRAGLVGLLGTLLSGSLPATAADQPCRLTLTITDAASGDPLAARVYLRSTDGTPQYFTSASSEGSAVRYEKQNWNNLQSVEYHTTVSAHPSIAELMPGDYVLMIERGQTYFPVERELRIEWDTQLDVTLTRWYDPASQGWYSGDTHIHRTIDELRNVVLAEDLNVAMPLTNWVTRADTPPSAGDKNLVGEIPDHLITVDQTHVILPRNTEYEIFTVGKQQHTLGALFVLGHKEPLQRGVPPWKPVIDQAIASGAALDMDKLDWPFSMLLPTLAPTALYELANNHMWRTEFGFRQWNTRTATFLQPPFGDTQGGEREWIDYTMGMYYALLNCGLRMPPSAGTANGVHPVPAGFGRVYVHVPGEFSYDAWFSGLKEGRSFVSTGPILQARAGDKLPGGVFALPAGKSHQIEVAIDVHSANPIAYGELIVNGRPQQLLRAGGTATPEGATKTTWRTQVAVEESGWFAVRVWETRPGNRIRFAHTAPWYVQIGEEPVRIPRDEREYLVRRVLEEIERSQGVLDDAALAEYRQALEFYQSRPVTDDRMEVDAQARSLPAEESRPPGLTREEWLRNMIVDHRFTPSEVRLATGLSIEESQDAVKHFSAEALRNTAAATNGSAPDQVVVRTGEPIRILPYPGGRHPRRGFLEGAIRPQRDTKLSIFPPWEDGGYVVVDIPEALFSNLGLTYLAHDHIPTIWTEQGTRLEPLEWERTSDGWRFERTLPNGIRFGSRVWPSEGRAEMQMWLTNGTPQKLTGLRSQVCMMLKGAKGFQTQDDLTHVIRPPFVAIRAADQDRWIITAWQPCQRAWTNPPVPCIHSDPQFPDCEPGETVRVSGQCWFYEGEDIDEHLRQLNAALAPEPPR